MAIGPALVLSVIVGLFHVSAYVFIRGRAGARVPLLLLAAILGAWAGDAIGARLSIDPLRVGEFHLISASVVAWLGIALVAILAGLVPERAEPEARPAITTRLSRAEPSESNDPPAIEPDRIEPAGAGGPEPEATR